ncbi:signal peptide peptidase SppA [Candidatus Woesearchaeota archaeon]|nr:MAG: signal peptide peptidase SppA [Candidatus Woesearchaeota archaeon]
MPRKPSSSSATSQDIKKRSPWLTSFIILAFLFVLAYVFSAAISLIAGASSSGNVALIRIHGPIVVDSGVSSFDSGVSSTDVIQMIDSAVQRGFTDFVFDINSPGGSAVASYEIAQKIKFLNAKNFTTIAVIRDVGASGAYWVASAAEEIYANPLSITGSIGVYASYLDFAGLLSKYNVSYERLVAGEMKDAGSPWRHLTDEERELFQKKLDLIHEEFISEVASNRNLSIELVKEHADGFIMLGSEAKEQGFVDSLGTLEDVKEHLAEVKGEPVEFYVFESKPSLAELLSRLKASFSFYSFSNHPRDYATPRFPAPSLS